MVNKRDVGIGLAVGFVLGWLLAGFFGDWRPVGDGRIVNARTGELRVTATGEDLDDYLLRLRHEREAEEKRAAARRRYESAQPAIPGAKWNWSGWENDEIVRPPE